MAKTSRMSQTRRTQHALQQVAFQMNIRQTTGQAYHQASKLIAPGRHLACTAAFLQLCCFMQALACPFQLVHWLCLPVFQAV